MRRPWPALGRIATGRRRIRRRKEEEESPAGAFQRMDRLYRWSEKQI